MAEEGVPGERTPPFERGDDALLRPLEDVKVEPDDGDDDV